MDHAIEISAPTPDTDAIRERWFAEVQRANDTRERRVAAISTVLACVVLAGGTGFAVVLALVGV